MFQHCPHATVRYSDEADEDEDGPIPAGWSINISGCVPLNVRADTFRGVIDAAIAESARQDAAIAAGEDPEQQDG